MIGWTWCGFHKKHGGTRYVKLVFLHLSGSVGHVLGSSVSKVRNIDTLFFMLGWAPYGSHKKHIVICHVELVFLHPV
jgi:hypothetical protein